MKHLSIIATGGTIGNTDGGRVGIEEVLADVSTGFPSQNPYAFADLEVDEVLREGGETFTPDEWRTIGRAVRHHVSRPDVDGVVITHGTFTAEETAYFVHLTTDTAKPIVVACSQRKHGSLGNDGDRNLVDAIRVAASDDAGGRGALVVLNEEIHSAREVTKTSRRPSGFHSDHSGILGTVEEDQVTFYREPTRRHTTRSEFGIPERLPRVDIVATYAGADGAAVDGVLSAGAEGIVVNGFSYSGKPHRNQRPSLERAVGEGVPVVLVNRGGDGRMPVIADGPFVQGDNLTAQKARILLMLCIAHRIEPGDVQRVFSQY